MKYLSLDLETTGLDGEHDQILQVSMVVEDTEATVMIEGVECDVPVERLPHFTCFVKHERIHGNAFALSMNSWILDRISGRVKEAGGYPIYKGKDKWTVEEEGYHDTWVKDANMFLEKHFGQERITVAGKNVAGFDIPFLHEVLRKRFRHRVIDVGSLFINWQTDKCVPDLAECKKRADLGVDVAHDAREDAMDVISLLRTKYRNGN